MSYVHCNGSFLANTKECDCKKTTIERSLKKKKPNTITMAIQIEQSLLRQEENIKFNP